MAVRELLAAYRDHEDLISIGAYRRGSNKTVDVPSTCRTTLTATCGSRWSRESNVEDARNKLMQLYKQISGRLNTQPQK